MQNFIAIGQVVFAGECVSIKTGCTSYNTSKPVVSYLFLSILDSILSCSTSIFFVDNCCCIAAIILLKALEMTKFRISTWEAIQTGFWRNPFLCLADVVVTADSAVFALESPQRSVAALPSALLLLRFI